MKSGYYLESVKIKFKNQFHISTDSILGKELIFADENTDISTLDNIRLAIIGIPHSDINYNKGCSEAPDKIREKLYHLSGIFNKKVILDLGNLKKGKTQNDTFFAFREIFTTLLKKNIPLIILGGKNNISYTVYQSYSELKNSINISSVSSKIEPFNIQNKKDQTNYLEKILSEKDNYLFNFTNIGYQNYYVSDDDISILNKLMFNTFRLGVVRENIREVEPEIRDTDFLSFDISSIRQADAPAHQEPCPNGFFGEEACQIAKYAGISDRLNCFGLFELNPEFDNNSQTINLASQIIWYFIEGLKLRNNDFPNTDIQDFTKFIVELSESEHKIIFYKSPRSDRWWMEVPSGKADSINNIIVACSFEDYQRACNQEVPDRWLKTFQKLR